VESVGEGVRGRRGVGGVVEEAAFDVAEQAERTGEAVLGQEVFGVPVFDVGGDAAAVIEEAGADAVRDLVVDDGEVGRVRAGGAEEDGSRAEGVEVGPAEAGHRLASESVPQEAQENTPARRAIARQEVERDAAEGRASGQGGVKRFGGRVVAGRENGDGVTGLAEHGGFFEDARVARERTVGDNQDAA
jgi:hypothetical protein